ncbi:MAG: zf-HC2 domain-containing protein [Deltaproteobacteria bacterium]|nr:zf-HC2 domain-containing protein [Deltaproteobacteria bacterium]
MVKCKDLFGKMSEYLDGEMDLAMIEEAERHIGHCTECKETLDTFRKSVALIKRTKTKKLPHDDRKRLKELIQREMEKM